MRSSCLKNISLCLIIYLLNSFASFAQSGDSLLFQKIDEKNGLSDNNVQCIYKDRNDFMWIGTSSGLNLLNGSGITVFKNIPDDIYSISDNFITDITGDSTGSLWVGTRMGLNSFDPVLKKFTSIPLTGNASTKKDFIVSIAVDKKNNILAATSSGLYFYDRKTDIVTPIEVPGDNYEKILNNNITHIAFGPQGLLWLSTYNGLWSYNENTHQFIHEISAQNDPDFTRLFTNFIIGHSGKLWIGTWDKGVKEYDPQSKKIITHTIADGRFNVICLAEIKQTDHTYSVCINGNSLAWDEQQNIFTTVKGPLQPDDNTVVSVMYASANNWLWLGTHSGLYFFDPSKNFIRHHRFNKSITSQGISILQCGKKILVTGSGNYFLRAYNENLDETDNFQISAITKDISCLSLRDAGNNTIKCGTSAGVADINLATHAISFHHIPKNPNNSPTVDFITNLQKDKYQNWWLFPWRNGIWITDSSYHNTRQLVNNFITEYNVPKPLVISDACVDKNNNIWFGDYDEGILFYDSRKKQFSKPFIKTLGEKNTITQLLLYHNYCYSFSGTNLLMWNVDHPDLQKIKLSSKIDKPITYLAFDSIGHLWIATLNGLLVYNFKTKNYVHFTTADGLLSNEMNGTLYCTHDGTMIFGCPDFLSAFQPKKMLGSIDNIPRLRLSEMVVNGKPYPADTSRKMKFDHTSNNFIFRWAVTDYNDPLNNRYYYQLQGIDKDWHFVGKSGEVEFASLSPGSYTLLLKGENSNGITAANIIKIGFYIRLPFWRAWWFLTLLFCTIGGIFYSTYRYRLNQHLKIEKLRNKISLDLHDDIGSTLSSISILSNMALHGKKNTEPERENMLKEIKENSISLMEKMDDIVWSINPKNDSLINLFTRIQSFASKLFEAKEINYQINIGENIKNVRLPMEFRQHIYLIMKEAINNLVKYSDCTEARINVSNQSSLLSISITDNGKGFDTQKAVSGNGIMSMKKRSEMMKAHIEIQSEKDKGTRVVLSVKIK